MLAFMLRFKEYQGLVGIYTVMVDGLTTTREVRRQLSEIYRHRTLYETHVQKILHADVTDHEQHSLRVTQNWLSMNAPIFRDSYRRVKRRVITGMRSI